jgi:hypothetical protein
MLVDEELAVVDEELAVLWEERELAVLWTERELAVLWAERELAVLWAERELAVLWAERELAVSRAERELAALWAERELAVSRAERELAVLWANKEVAVLLVDEEASNSIPEIGAGCKLDTCWLLEVEGEVKERGLRIGVTEERLAEEGSCEMKGDGEGSSAIAVARSGVNGWRNSAAGRITNLKCCKAMSRSVQQLSSERLMGDCQLFRLNRPVRK